MEAPPEEVLGSNDQTHIVKGKRTKRQRLPSPLAFTINNSTSSSSAGGGSGIGGGGLGEDDYNYYPSPTTSSTELFTSDESTEEEEDMANCLILLAQGHGRENLKQIEQGGASGGGGGGGGVMERSSSRRFTEATTTMAGKAGFYVYECKTCNRCFPSFQALGGHRASHKKPKAMVEEKENNKKASASLLALSPDEDEAQFKTNSPHSFSLHQMPNHSSSSSRAMYSNNKSKVHECSICGSEFSSGQALGGHMRRHRSAAAPTTTNNSGTFELRDNNNEETHKPRNVFQLDLNLPAPSDEDHHHHHRESKFAFSSKQQQQQQPPPPPPLIFSASALVDCHY
ncbi:zinc finger protein ZAT5-like [Telopea speciosissima]|uniref:zinc finger protein ZAT5-like n=1 Tax=Telopea speciosissima TaxID=54955 RepID=UPI001CC6BB05|nr:zinc finger protein ZAT5-like [Telopea speciosissima]